MWKNQPYFFHRQNFYTKFPEMMSNLIGRQISVPEHRVASTPMISLIL